MATKTTAALKTDESATSDGESSLEIVKKAFNQSWEYTQGSWHDRWRDNYRLYNNQRIKYGYKGISDTFVPMSFSTVETLTSALFGTKPKWGYLPPSDKADQNTDSLNALVDQWWDKDQWSMKVINTGRGGLREGTAVDYFCWDGDHPHMINVPIRDFFIDPNAYELDESSTRYCGRRYITTIEELESFEVIDLEAMEKSKSDEPIYKKKYKNLDQLKGDSVEEPVKGGSQYQEQTTDKQEKDLLYGSTLNEPQKNQVEVIEYWTVDKTISIANRKVDIEDVENYFKTQARKRGDEFPKGLLPFTSFRDYVDGSLFYAKGEIDIIADQQEDLNDFSNQMKDAVSFNLNQQKTLDPKYAHLLKEIQNIPGGVYPMEAGMLVPIPNGQIPPEAFNERQNIKSEIRETTASNEVIKGAPDTQSGKGAQTATEINAQVAGSGQRISLKVTQIENEYFHRMGKIIHRMAQLYVTEPMMVRVLSKNGVTWQKFDPKEFQGEYEPRVQLDISLQGKKQQQATDAANLMKAFMGDPNINQQELSKIVLQRGFDLDPDEVQALMAPQGGQPGADGMPQDLSMAGAMPPMGALPPGMPMPPPGAPQPPTGPPPKQPYESITFKDVVASGAIDSAAAMLEQAGLPADDIQAQRPAPGQVVGGQVQQPQPPADTSSQPLVTGSHTDIIPHPQTGEPVMAGSLG